MKTGFYAFLWLAIALLHPNGLQTGDFSVASPHAGDALQGIVYIQGTTTIEGFRSLDLSFTYTGAPGGTWFLIGEIDQPVANGPLLAWDTTTLTDGDYDLRAAVHLKDGSSQVERVNGLRVRNYTAIEVPSPLLAATPTTVISTLSPAAPSTEALAPNPAVISGTEMRKSLVTGVGAAAGIFAVFGIYAWLRRKR
jgi:hypothetical protein